MGFWGNDSKQTQTSDPYAAAKPAIDSSLGMVTDANKDPWEVYQGDQVAKFTPDQLNAMQQGRHYYSDQSNAQSLMNSGNNMLGGYDQAMAGYGNMANQSPVQNMGPDMGRVAEYANNPYLDGQIDAVNRDVQRGLFEQELPGITDMSGQGGNLGSSRRGMLEGMAMRGAGDRMGDNAAMMRSNAWQNGMNTASATATQNAQLSMQNRGMQMGAYGGMMNIGNAGVNNMVTGHNMFGSNNAGLMGIGNTIQGQNQNELGQAAADHYLGQQLPYQQAQAGMGVALPAGQAFGTQTMQNSGGMGWGNQLLNVGSQLGSSAMMSNIPGMRGG